VLHRRGGNPLQVGSSRLRARAAAVCKWNIFTPDTGHRTPDTGHRGASRRWVFWINLPIGLMALAARVLKDHGERTRRRLDPLGMITLGLGLFAILWTMTKLAAEPISRGQVAYVAEGCALLVVFVLIELRHPEPSVDLSVFRIPTMATSLLATLLQNLGSFAVLFLVIMYLQGPRRF
jgi:hypothetical protein